MKKEQTVCFNIKTAWHAISRMYNEQATKYGYTSAMGFVLLNIDAEYGTPATKIAPELGMETRSLSRMLKKMEMGKLIYRKQDETDKRLVKIFLTQKGIQNKELAKKIVKKFNNTVREQISNEKLQIFFEVIAKINNIIAEKEIYR